MTMSETEQAREVTLVTILKRLPPELVGITKVIHDKLCTRSGIERFSMTRVDMTDDDGIDTVGIEILCQIPNNGRRVAVLLEGNNWFVAVIGEHGGSEGGWSRPQEDTSLDEVVEMVRVSLLIKSGNN
jgi:hypothetical protein